MEEREKVDVKEETDRVYAGVGPEGKLTLEYGGKEGGGVEVEIGGFVDGEFETSSSRFLFSLSGEIDFVRSVYLLLRLLLATIWNPGEKTGSAMGDMQPKGW